MVQNRRVLRLKVVCEVAGISSRRLARAVGCSQSYINGGWREEHEIKQDKRDLIEKYLEDQGVPAKGIWDRVNEKDEFQKLAYPKANGGKANPDEKLLTLGVMMLRRQVREHFGLKRDPFQPRIDDKPYQSKAFNNCRNAIEDAIDSRAFLAISGPTGCGKSVLWTWIHQRLNQDASCQVVMVRRFDKDSVRENDIYKAILADLAGEVPRGGGKEQTHRRVEELLVNQVRLNVNVILLVNEAHDLGIKGLVMLKRVWESFNDCPDLGYMRACTVILLGQEGLEASLRKNLPELREVSQRADLERYGALDADEVALYLTHRFGREVGAFTRIFEQSAINYMGARSIYLTPQLVNIMATQAMNKAFQVGAKQVTEEHIGRLIH